MNRKIFTTKESRIRLDMEKSSGKLYAVVKRFKLNKDNTHEPCTWWLRSAVEHDVNQAGMVNNYGNFVASYFIYSADGILPACTI